MLTKQRFDEFPNIVRDGVDRTSCINQSNALWLSRGDGVVAVFNATKEFAVCFLESITFRGAARTTSRLAHFDGNAQEQREMRTRFADGDVDHVANKREIEFATIALIRGGRIVEAIAQYNFTRGKGRADDFAYELRAAGVHQQQF